MKKLLYLCLLPLLLLTACNDDESVGVPVITGVRSCDPAKADSLFSKASQGQMIAIIGQNLGNAKKVYINDQNVSFSTTMNTDHSIIVSVPQETKGFQLTAFNKELKDEIRVETPGGIATYSFKVLNAYPTISRIQATYPRQAGDVLNIYGTNLVSIEKLYFTDITAAALDTTKWEEIGGNHIEIADYKDVVQNHYLDTRTQNYTTDSQLSIVIPDLPYDEGCLVLECTAGTRYIAFTKTPGKPVIKTISSDMPVLGEVLHISGNEFVQLESIQMGDVIYTPDEFTVAENESDIDIPITKIPSLGSDALLTITTPGGVCTLENFYQYAGLLNDFDEMIAAGTAIDEGWSPNAEYVEATDFGGTGTIAHIETSGGWWDKMVFFKRNWEGSAMLLPTFDVIPADAPADHIYLAFETYDVNSDWNNGGDGYQGYLRLAIWFGNNIVESNSPDIQYDNFAWDNYEEGTFKNPDGPCLQDVNGQAHQGKWYRSVFPLNKLTTVDGDGAVVSVPYRTATYQDIYNNGIGIIRFMALNQGAKPGSMNFYMDNVRLIYIK